MMHLLRGRAVVAVAENKIFGGAFIRRSFFAPRMRAARRALKPASLLYRSSPLRHLAGGPGGKRAAAAIRMQLISPRAQPCLAGQPAGRVLPAGSPCATVPVRETINRSG